MKSFTTLIVSLLAVLPCAYAHGFVNQVVIDGKVYKGNTPNNPKFASPVRLIDDISPVKGSNNRALNCGPNAQKAELVADAKPGSSLAFSWFAGGGENWPHNIGPMMTYLAECTGTTCDKFDAANAKWFKIDQVGKKSDGKTWKQQDIMDGGSLTVKLPGDLKSGDYLVRHEIIALHLATSKGGAEFYPSCTQIRVSGNGNGAPKSSELVSFPGGYSDSDPGIFDPTVFDTGSKYTFPGPKIATLAASGAGSGSGVGEVASSASASVPASSSKPTPTSAAPNASKTSHCLTKKDKEYKPRQLSRVMRSLLP